MSNIQLINNLYRLRKANHYTQQQISDILNISRQAYSNYETSKRSPDLDSLIHLSQLYNVTLDQLVNQTCTKNGIVNERNGPYTPALEIASADTLYLAKDEVDLIQKYRMLPKEEQMIVRRFLG